jgi:tetratricopeptide (TPR) repeat protein
MCLWDIESSIEATLSGWGVTDVLNGYIPKHSKYFYERRLEYTLPMLQAKTPNPARFDDAAVAYDKIGAFKEAIQVIEEKEERFPGLYETYSNWGTFLTHDGKLREGLALLNKALTINPNAHFGREHYQISLIEFGIESKEDPGAIKKRDFLGLDLIKAREDLSKPQEEPMLAQVGLKEDVFAALTALMRFGAADKHAGTWFSLGLAIAYGYPDGQYFAMQSMRRAELLGHPLASEWGETLHHAAQQLAPLTRPWYRKALDPHQDLLREFDLSFQEGQNEVLLEQAEEDNKLNTGDTSIFGY